MKIHDKCSERLSTEVEKALGDITVHYGNYLAGSPEKVLRELEKILPADPKFREEIESYVSDDPLADFILGELGEELHSAREFESDSPVIALSALPEYQDLTAVSKRLIRSFCALPRTYKITFKLGPSMERMALNGEFHFNPSIRLVRADDELAGLFPMTTGNEIRDHTMFGGGLLTIPIVPKWDGMYIQVEVQGYIRRWVTTSPVDRAFSLVKSFVGLAIATRAARLGRGLRQGTGSQRAFVHEQTGGGWKLIDAREVPESLSTALHDFQPVIFPDIHKTEEARVKYFVERLKEIAAVLKGEEDNSRLLLAARWLFDSRLSREDLLAYVQAMVSMEILLGDKAVSDLMGLGELLRNRCAYLIGRTHTERDELLEDFRKIYEVRSRIVHGGKDKLSRKEFLISAEPQPRKLEASRSRVSGLGSHWIIA